MNKKYWLTMSTLAASIMVTMPGQAQIIGSYDNFDCFNDTGSKAEGFEIDIEDIKPSDIVRIFPDNFPAGQPYIRWATPDRGALTPVTFPDGHTGVSIVYAAHYVAGHWRTIWGGTVMPGTATKIGDGTPFVAHPNYTSGDSCWTLGLGVKYPTSGCDHFGYSLAAGKAPGKITTHWLLPDAVHPGTLLQAGTLVSLPPGPVLTPQPVPKGALPVVHVVAQAPEQPEYEAQALCSDAYWLRTYTSYGAAHVDLNGLQKNKLPMKGAGVTIAWKLLQHCPASVDVDKAENEKDGLPKNAVQITKRHEYFAYAGEYDSNHEVVCGGDASCDVPVKSAAGVSELGAFKGAHNAAYDVK